MSPEKSHKQGDRPDRDADVKENVLGGGQNEDVELCAEVVLLTFSKNWTTKFEPLKKSIEKVDQRTEIWPIEKRVFWGGEMQDAKLRPK